MTRSALRLALPFALVVLASAMAPLASAATPARASNASTDAAGRKLILLPAGNLSGQAGASEEVEKLLAGAMADRGWSVVRGAEIDELLETERVRYFDSLDSAVCGKLLSKSGSEAILASTVYTYNGGKNPAVALEAKLFDRGGRVSWENVVGLTAKDTEGMFQLGRIDSRDALAIRAVRDLLAGFPGEGAAPKKPAGRGKPWGRKEPATFVSRDFGGERPRIAVLPLKNLTEARAAGSVLGEILPLRLSDRFDVVESAEVRKALVDARIRTLRGLEPAALRALGKRLKTSLFLEGTVYRYRDAPPGSLDGNPELEVQLTLTDVDQGKVVWTAAQRRTGADYRRLLQLGAISNVVTLADQLFSEMLRSEEKAVRSSGGKK